MHKKFILNQLESFIERPKDLLASIKDYGLIIFDNNVVMTTEKMYYAEMIPIGNDMQLCKNSKKVEFLKKLGFDLEKDPEVSLTSFLSLSSLENKLSKIFIQNKSVELCPYKYRLDLEEMEESKEIKKIYCGAVKVKSVKAEC